MSSPINVGVIGCGYWGPNLVRNFKALTSCRLKAICDVNESRLRHLRTLYSDIDAHTDAATLINDPEVHAIAIATPVAYHYNLAKASLLAGKHTLVEKPLAASIRAASTWDYFKRTSTSFGIWHHTIFPSSCTSLANCH